MCEKYFFSNLFFIFYSIRRNTRMDKIIKIPKCLYSTAVTAVVFDIFLIEHA